MVVHPPRSGRPPGLALYRTKGPRSLVYGEWGPGLPLPLTGQVSLVTALTVLSFPQEISQEPILLAGELDATTSCVP